MPLSVFQQTWLEARRPALRWMLVLAGVTWMLILVHPLFARLALIRPAWLSGLLPDGVFGTISQWAVQVVQGWVLPLLAAVYAARLGSALVAGEEERGSLGFLLAASVRRSRLVWEKAAVLALVLAGMALLSGFAFAVAAWAARIAVAAGPLLRGMLALALFGLLFGGLALALGCFTGRQRASCSITLLVIALTFVLGHLPAGMMAPALHWASPFWYYAQALRGETTGLLVLALLAAAALVLAWIGFERRDLPV